MPGLLFCCFLYYKLIMDIFSFLLSIFLYTPEPAKMNEADYVNKYCTGQIEYVLPDKTRVDCLTETHAIEYDWAYKHYEALGQSLHYAKLTGKKAGIVLIKKSNKDQKYIDACKSTIQKYKLPVTLQIVPKDF